MNEDTAREEIAFIRRAIAEGGGYVGTGSRDMLVSAWRLPLDILRAMRRCVAGGVCRRGWIGTASIIPSWIYSLRGTVGRPMRAEQSRPATVEAMRMLWLAPRRSSAGATPERR